jgi:prepilin-type N-terminal cleavage/methylation domain-containing protein
MDIQYMHIKAHTRCRGFSLVELMVALVITLILLAGIGQIFLSSKKSYTLQDSLSRMQESGRYAMDVLSQDLRRAGYWGGNADITEIGGTLPLLSENGNCLGSGNNDWARMLDRKVFGLNDNRTNYGCLPNTTLPPQDVLVVRFAAPWQVGGTTTPTYLNNHFYLRSSLFEGKLFRGSDEASNPITAAAVRTSELVSRVYFINPATAAGTNKCGGGTVPSLYRLGLVNGVPTVEEVAYGIENLQVQYGIDTNNDDSVDSFVNAAGPADSMWDQIIAVRIWLLVRSECRDTGYTNDTTYAMGDVSSTFNDSYRRKLYTTTVRLRNR